MDGPGLRLKGCSLKNCFCPGDAPDAGKQFACIKGLGKIIICSAVKALHAVFDFGFRGQHQYWDLISRRAELFQNRDHVHFRHHDIRYGSVITTCLKIAERILAVINASTE